MVHISELQSVDAIANDDMDSDDEGDAPTRHSESEVCGRLFGHPLAHHLKATSD